MTGGSAARIRIEVDADSPAEGILDDWLRRWRRREVRRNGKTLYPHQGATRVLYVRAPPEAVADLQACFSGETTGVITPAPQSGDDVARKGGRRRTE